MKRPIVKNTTKLRAKSSGQAMVEFGLTFGIFLLIVVMTVVAFTFLGVLAATYYSLNYMASQFVTDGRVARGFAILETNRTEAETLFNQALAEATNSGNSFVTGLLGRLFLEDLTVKGEDDLRKVVLFLPPELGQDRAVIKIGKDLRTEITYQDLLPLDSPCKTANPNFVTNCPVIGYAYVRFRLPFGLGLGFGVRSFEVIDSRSLRARAQGTPLAAHTPFIEQQNNGSNGGSTGNRPQPTPTRTPTPCPYQTVSFSVNGQSHSLRCTDAIDILDNGCRNRTVEYCTALENALDNLIGPCLDLSLGLERCDDGSCDCTGGGGVG